MKRIGDISNKIKEIYKNILTLITQFREIDIIITETKRKTKDMHEESL
jgi:hypothetical protein